MALRSIDVGITFYGAPAVKFSTLLEVTEVRTIYLHERFTRLSRCTQLLWDLWRKTGGKVYVRVLALEFSTLLEVFEVGTIYSHGSFMRPAVCILVALDLRG